MEIRGYLLHALHRNICWQEGIQGILQGVIGVVPVQVETDHLPFGMHTAVGAPRGHDCPALPAQPPQGFLKGSLDAGLDCLPLKAVVIRAVVSEDKFVMCHAFRFLVKGLNNYSAAYSLTSSSRTISALSPSLGPSLSRRV